MSDVISVDEDVSIHLGNDVSPPFTVPGRSMLTSVVSHMEMDPCSQSSWIDNALREAAKPGAPSLLEIFKNTDKQQTGGFIKDPIGMNTYNTVVAPPQAGKTQGIMLTAMEAGYDSGVLTVMSVMNSRLETPRFRATANQLNGIIATIAEKIGIRSENTPILRIFDEGSSTTYRTALNAWSRGSNVIPIFIVMLNNTKFDRFQRDHLPAIARATGRDGNGHLKIMMVTDEADLQYKTVNNTSQVERSIFSRSITLEGVKFTSLQEIFTIVTNVTATPQAIVSGDVKFGGRRPVIYEPQPSRSNFQFHCKSDWSNKKITRSTADSVDEMYEDMLSDEANRFALVYESKNCKVQGRSSAARVTAEKFADKFGVVTFAWSSGKIEAYTADHDWIQFFRGSPIGLFMAKQENKGVFSFTGKKSVNSYPSIINFMASRSAGQLRCKFILFAKEMTDRAIPVKGTGHQWPLTDMWIEAPMIPQESRIQVCGRLCGIDPVGTVKTLWSSEEEHEIHKKSIDTVQYIVDKLLRKGIGALDAIAKTRKTLVDLTDDTPVVSNIIVDEDSAIAQLGGTRISRPNAGKRTREMATDTKRVASSKKMKMTSEDYESGLSHADVISVTPEHIITEQGSLPEIDDSTTDPDTLAQMREASDGYSGNGVVAAIKEVVRDNGGPVEFSRMPLDMASRDEFPDGLSFSPVAFLKFIVRFKAGLLTSNGVQYVNGVFSVA